MKKIILTGDRPTGKLHLGHYIGSLKNRINLQETGDFEQYIMIADVQALTDNAKNPELIKNSVFEVAMDYLSVGIDPKKSVIFIQSQIPELTELTTYFMNLVTLSRLERNPTVKQEIKQKHFEKSLPVGFLNYPISQAADILGFKADYVPAGEDQLPMIEQTREIVSSFNAIYGKTFDNPEPIIPEGKFARRLPGIDGNAKMGKSLNNAIYLSDDEKTLHSKVMSMYTDPTHIKISDPGHVEGNMVFLYLDVFGEDKEKISELKKQYKKGGLGDVVVKNYLFEVLNCLLKPIREKRKYYENRPELVKKIVFEGNSKAREVVQQTLADVRKKIGIDYFN